jgi:hypothetical protein
VLLHVGAPVYTFAAHFSAPHTVPGAYFAQPPAPSQRPLVPHVPTPWSVQTLRLSSVLAAMGVQVPLADASAQLRHAPPQASLQQTPSTQNPDAQSAAAVQLLPFVCLPQLWFWQAMPGAQSAFALHVMLQAPAAHA